MTAATAEATPLRVEPVVLSRAYRFELVKLLSLWRLRLAFVACLLAPGIYSAVVSRQTSLPADALYSRLMGQSGWAGSLAVLGFMGNLVLPLVTSVVSGDIFAVEDRLGTWRHLLIAVRSRRRIFASKGLAALTVTVALVAALAASSIVGGLISIGNHPLPGLDGHPMGSGELSRSVLLAWLTILAPTLAFSAVGLLGSIAFGRSPLGLLLPVALALVLTSVQLMPLPAAIRVGLPMNAFISYRGLFTQPGQLEALWIGLAVSLSWAVLATYLAYRLFMRRDFTDPAYEGSGRRFIVAGLAPLVGLAAASTIVIAAATGATESGIDRHKLESALATSYAHLYVLQTAQLNRPAVTEDQLHATVSCDKGGVRVADAGPGADWRCVVTWTLPGATATGNAIYQLDVSADGRYVADGDGPKEVNGFFQVRTPMGDEPNPLWQFDGVVELLDDATKGQ